MMVGKDKKRVTSKKAKEYGIVRVYDETDNLLSWHVSIGRRGHSISRQFFDNTYGGAENAHAMAKAYRDAAIALFPPQTNIEVSATPRKNNTSGVTGVNAAKYKGKIVSWEASLRSNHVQKRKIFTVHQYGTIIGAKEAAIAQREEWLAESEIYFKSSSPLATKVAKNCFPEYLEHKKAPKWTEEDDRVIKKQMADLDAYFDTLRPSRVTVSIGVKSGRDSLILYLSDVGSPVRKQEREISVRVHSLGPALAILRDRTLSFLQEVFGDELCEAFLAIYGDAFTEAGFDRKNGLSIRDIPENIIKMSQKRSGDCSPTLI